MEALGYAAPTSAFVIPHIFIKTTKIHKDLMKTKLVRKFPTSCFDGARAYNDQRLEIIALCIDNYRKRAGILYKIFSHGTGSLYQAYGKFSDPFNFQTLFPQSQRRLSPKLNLLIFLFTTTFLRKAFQDKCCLKIFMVKTNVFC